MSAPTQTQARPAQTQAQAKPTITEDLSLLDAVVSATATKMDAIAKAHAEMEHKGLGALQRALGTASAIKKLDAALDEKTMELFMRLMNTSLGFKTDRPNSKNNTPYGVVTVKRILIEALLRGLLPWNNEFNIIADNLFIAANGWTRLVNELPGVTGIEVVPGIPAIANGVMCCRVAGRWSLKGQPQELRGTDGSAGRIFPCGQQNSYSTPDNNIGKATRRAYKAIHALVTGQILEEGEEPEPMVAIVPSAPSGPKAGKETFRKAAPQNGEAKAPAAETKPPESETPPAEESQNAAGGETNDAADQGETKPENGAAEAKTSEPEAPPATTTAASDQSAQGGEQQEQDPGPELSSEEREEMYDEYKKQITACATLEGLEKVNTLVQQAQARGDITEGNAITLKGMVQATRPKLRGKKGGAA
jgi:hypothetical protein